MIIRIFLFQQSPTSIVKAVLKTEPVTESPDASNVESPLQPRSLQPQLQRQPTVIAAERPEHHQHPQQQQLIQVSIPRGILAFRASSADANCDIEGQALRGPLLYRRQFY